jgi:hypothetical protein
MFFIKKSEIVLDCFTDLPHAYDFAKINRAIKFLPEWWKDTPKLENNRPTIKNCQGLIDFYLNGIAIPSWFNLQFKIYSLEDSVNGNRWEWRSSTDDLKVDYHSLEQFFRFSEQDSTNVKIMSPWLFKTKENVFFSMTQPTWNHREWLNHLVVLPGLLNFKDQHRTNINFLAINGPLEKRISIDPLTPLVILHCMSDKKVVIKNHLVDTKEIERMDGYHKFVFKQSHQEIINKRSERKKLFDKVEEIDSCPFK